MFLYACPKVCEMAASTMNEPVLSLSKKIEYRGWTLRYSNDTFWAVGNWNCPPGSSELLLAGINIRHVTQERVPTHLLMYGFPHHVGTFDGALKASVVLADRTARHIAAQEIMTILMSGLLGVNRDTQTPQTECSKQKVPMNHTYTPILA